MVIRVCENCKHNELCIDSCAFFEEKKLKSFYIRHNPLSCVYHVRMQPEGKVVGTWRSDTKGLEHAADTCDRLNELWAEKNGD